MVHQALEEYDSLPKAQTINGTMHEQGATKLLKLNNKYLLMVTFDYGENYLIWFKFQIMAH